MGEAEKDVGRGEPGGNLYARYIDEADVMDKIEVLQNHTNNEIYEKAVHIIETYFELEEEEDAVLAPTMDASHNAYAFGVPPGAPGGGDGHNLMMPQGGFSFGAPPGAPGLGGFQQS